MNLIKKTLETIARRFRDKLLDKFWKAKPEMLPIDTSLQYKWIRHIGNGAHGDVSLYRHIKSESLVAIKLILHNDPFNAPQEVRMLELLSKHTNIVEYFETTDDLNLNNAKRLVFENCDKGDLMKYLKNSAGEVSESFVWNVFKQLSNGLNYIHSHGVVHGDIKPENILRCTSLCGGEFPVLKIADFGTSQINPPHKIPLGHFGTWQYCPNEAEYRFGPEHDIWSLGCIIHVLCHIWGTRPLASYNVNRIDAWFEEAGKVIPLGTPLPGDYKHFCFYLKNCPVELYRVDRPTESCAQPKTKLLNYWMMRALDLDWKTRVTANELHRFLSVLVPFLRNVQDLSDGKYMSIFHNFDDESNATDSSVVWKLFCTTARLAAEKKKDVALLGYGAVLLRLMDAGQRERARHCLHFLGLRLPEEQRFLAY